MVPDEDEFVNFSDDEIAVTLSLDNFSISSRKSSSSFNDLGREKVNALSQHIDNEATKPDDHQIQRGIHANDHVKSTNDNNINALPLFVGDKGQHMIEHIDAAYADKTARYYNTEELDLNKPTRKLEFNAKDSYVTDGGRNSDLEVNTNDLENIKAHGENWPLNISTESNYLKLKLLTKEEDVMICRQTPISIGIEDFVSKPLVSNNFESPNGHIPVLYATPVSEQDTYESGEVYEDVFEDYSDYSDDTLELESDDSDKNSPQSNDKLERRPSLDTDERNINQLGENVQLDASENNEKIGKDLFTVKKFPRHDANKGNDGVSQYSETSILKHTRDSNKESPLYNNDSLIQREESEKSSTIQTDSATKADKHQISDTESIENGDEYTSLCSGYEILSVRIEQNNGLHKSHLHSTSDSSNKMCNEVTSSTCELPSAVLPRRRSNLHTKTAKETHDKMLIRTDYTVELTKLRQEKARKMIKIYEKASLERKRRLLRLKEQSKSKFEIVNHRKSSNSSLKSNEGAPSNIRIFSKIQSYTEYNKEYNNGNKFKAMQETQKGEHLLCGNGIHMDRIEGKPHKPMNINAFHNQILAINSKLVKEYTKSATAESNKSDVFTIGTVGTDGDKSACSSLEFNEMPNIDTSCRANLSISNISNSNTTTNVYSRHRDKVSLSIGPDKIEHKDVSSTTNGKVLKIEAGAASISRLSTYSRADDDKANYNRNISTGNLLREDYTSGNCNINTPSERYARASSGDNRHSVVHAAPCNRHRTRRVDIRPECSIRKPTCKSKAGRTHTNTYSGQCNVEDSPSDHSVTMSGKLRQRNSSGLADLARLQDIRRELLLTESEVDDAILHGDIFTNESLEKQHAKRLIRKNETLFIVQEILNEVIRKVFRNRSGYRNSELRQKRYTTVNDNGEEVLCCILQAPCDTIDPSGFACELLDPLDVPRVTGKHELLISHIVHLTALETGQAAAEQDLVAIVPIVNDYVAPWQEVVIKELDCKGKWVDNGEPADMINIEDGGKIVHCVQMLLKDVTSVAVIARPKTNCLPMGNQSITVTSSADPRVQMRVPALNETDGVAKHVTLQVLPIEHTLLTEFRNARYLANDIDVTAATSLIVMTLTGQNPETVSFVAKCLKTMSGDELSKGETAPVRYKGCHIFRERINQLQSLKPPEHVSIPKRTPSPRPSKKMGHKSDHDVKCSKDMHLVQIGEDSEVRLKLLEDNDREVADTGREHTVKFSVYDKSVRLLALETRSGLQYAEIQRLAQSFTDFVVKHRVRLSVGQDTRNIYSVHFSMTTYLPYKTNTKNKKKDPISPNHLSTYLQIEEGDLVGVVFRGNIDVLNQTQHVYSFHGYRGINKIFDIQVGDTFSQRSLQSFHGGVKIFTLKGPRYSAIDKMELPNVRTNWELRAEFPLILPKFVKKTPVTINKAPVSLRFQEPLTVDYISKICTDLVEEWEQFAAALGISHARIQSIKQQNRNVISERMLMDIVVCWMKQQPISRDKVGPLMHALTSCGKWKLAAELGKRHDATSTKRTHTNRDKKLQRSIALISKSKHVTCKWQQIYCHLSREDKSEEQLKKNMAAIETKYETEATRCYRALCRWKAETTPPPSVWNLVDALRSCQCSSAAESLTVLESKRL